MKLRSFVILALVIAVMGSAYADWHALNNSRGPSELQVKLLSSTDQEVKLELTIPGFHMRKVRVNGKKCVMIQIPGSGHLMKSGYPLMPKLAKLIKIHDRCEVKLEVLEKEEAEVKLPAPIVPSKGHMTRDIDPRAVPYQFGPIYKQDTFWPKKQFCLGKPFVLRDVRGIRLGILPISANHVQMVMKVLKKAVIVLKCEGASYENTIVRSRAAKLPGKTFSKLYQSSFLNYTSNLRSGVPAEDNKNLVVVTPESLKNGIQAWIAWKKKCGYTVDEYVVADGTSASTIKSYLQQKYDAGQLGYVVLIGDAAYQYDFETATPMPTFKGKKEGAAADRVYVRLAGNDNYPDAFISRISGTSTEVISAQLDKLIKYEQGTYAGDWLKKGMCIASNQGSPADYERAEWLQNGGGSSQKVPVLDGGLLGAGYTSFTDVYDPSGNSTMVGNAIDNGCGVICYIGHGSATSWVSSGFNVSDIHNLSNGNMLPIIWSVACVNGQFVHKDECFGEAWLRKTNGGAVGIECASTNESWVPPCDKQAATVNAMITGKYSTFGALEAEGVIAGLQNWDDTDSSEGNKMAEQCNLFGDCTLVVRTAKSLALNVAAARGLDSDLSFQVTSEGTPVANAIVTVYTQDLSYVVTGQSDGNGNVSIRLTDAPAASLFYTVTGQNMTAIVDQPID